MGGRMERERPEYLQPIPRSRWEFPWMALWAVLLLGMAGAGIWLHLKTGSAWDARFQAAPAPSTSTSVDRGAQPETIADRKAMLTEVRARREQAEREAQQRRSETRCIGGITFRRIPGGWENLPDQPCP